ncbi:MAG: dihydrofolate reductase [Gammaproteobacteria bacterium]|nr:dihydrofolate reductase [Gammaproteobacteria bacterium]
MKLSLIWAMSRNRVIGRNNRLPWKLPKDSRFFRTITMGRPVIMGRRTFESQGRPLPGRTNIVLTRSGFTHDGVRIASTLDAALEIAESQCLIDGVEECFVTGGTDIYALALPRADRLYETLIDAEVDGDTFFPPYDPSEFTLVAQEDFDADEEHAFPFSIRVLDRGK